MDLQEQEAIFNKIYKLWATAIYSYIFYNIGDKEASEDLVQDVFVKYWDKLDQIGAEKEKAYLYSIAKNLLINRGAHQKVVIKFVNQLTISNEPESPHFHLEAKEFQKKLELAISDLNEGQREVFLMHRIEGLKYKEIAERLSLSQKAIEKRMNKALQELRKVYKKL